MNANILIVAFLALVLVIAAYLKKNQTTAPTTKAVPRKIEQISLPPSALPESPKEAPEKVAPKTVATYEEAIAAAKASDCNIFLYLGAPWCPACVKMKDTTLAEKDVKDKMAAGFVILIINTDEDKTVARKFGIRGIPAYMVIDKDGNVIRKTSGFKSKADFLKWLGDK